MNHMPIENLHMISSLWPYAKWGLDIGGPGPRASMKEKFILEATDYFTKWAKTVSSQKISLKEVVNFLYRFKVPKALIMSNGK